MGITKKAKEVVEQFTSTDVYYDPDFNRKRGNWTDKLKRDAIKSYNRGWVTADIVLADIAKCLEYVKKHTPTDTYSIEYFQNLLNRGFKYIGLDGQHKTEDTLIAFFNNEFTYHGVLRDADDVTVNIVNQYYKDLSTRVQDAIRDMSVNVTIFEDVTADELSEIFVDHQKGKPLTDQDKRHAIPTPLSRWVRLRTEGIAACFEKLLTPRQIKESGDRELMAKFIMVLDRTEEFDLSATALDSFYERGSGVYHLNDSDYDQQELDRAQKITEQFSSIIVGADRTKKIPSNLAWALLLAIEYVYDTSEYMIGDNSKFFDGLETLHEKLKTRSHVAYAKAREAADRKGQSPPSESAYYHKWVTVPHQSIKRTNFKIALRDEIEKNPAALRLKKLPATEAAK